MSEVPLYHFSKRRVFADEPMRSLVRAMRRSSPCSSFGRVEAPHTMGMLASMASRMSLVKSPKLTPESESPDRPSGSPTHHPSTPQTRTRP